MELWNKLPDSFKDLENETFVIDLRNRTIMGADGNTSNVGDVQKAQLPSFTALIELVGAGGGSSGNPFKEVHGGVKNYYPRANRSPHMDMSDSARYGSAIEINPSYNEGNTQGSTDHLGDNVYTDNGEVRTANIRVNYIIKY